MGGVAAYGAPLPTTASASLYAERRQAASIASAQLAEQAAARRLQAGTALAGISNANIGQLASVGEYYRQMEQERLQAPLSLLTSQVGLAGQLPLQLFQGNVQKSKSFDPLDVVKTLAGATETAVGANSGN